MPKANMKQIAFIATGLLLVTQVHAESTLVLDLQDQLIRQSASFDQQLKMIETLNNDLPATKKLYNKTRRLKRGSRNHNYAVGQYVNHRLDTIEPKIISVKKLRKINWDISDTVERLGKAIKEQDSGAGREGLRALKADALDRAASQMLGSNQLMAVLSMDPAVSSSPEFRSVEQSYLLSSKRLMNSVSDNNTDVVDRLEQLNQVIEAQGVLLEIAWQQLTEDASRLQIIDTTGITSMVAVKIQKVLDKVFGVFGDKSTENTREMDRKILEDSFTPITPRGSSRINYENMGARIEAFRAKLGS